MDTLRAVPVRPWQRDVVRVFLCIALFTTLTRSTLASFPVHGTVVNSRTGAPIAGATIRVATGGVVALSGSDGEFTIAVADSGPARLTIRRIGYEPYDYVVRAREQSAFSLRIPLVEATYSVDPVVSTATRDAVSADNVPFSVEAVSAADLRMRSAADLGELLSTVPGVLVQGYGALGDVQTLSLRGSTASQVLILLDGQRLNTAQSGEIDLSTLPLGSVRRVEIVRGGASAQYGADAMGGVVNIITDGLSDDAPSAVNVRSTVGSFGARGAQVNASLRLSKVSASFAYRFLQSNNAFLYAASDGSEAVRQNADMKSQGVTGKMVAQLSDVGGRLSLDVDYLHQESGDPGSLAYPLRHARKLSRNVMGSAVYEQPFGGHLVSFQAYVHALRFGYSDPDSYIPTANDNHNTASGVEIGDTFTPTDRLSLAFGYCYRSDRYTGDGLGGEHSRGSHGAYLQGDIRPLGSDGTDRPSISLVPAIRWDRFSDFGSSVSPKFGIAASVGSAVRVTFKGNIGTSFRAPTFNDLYWPFDGFTAGNSLLKPERSTDIDAGIIMADSGPLRLRASLTYYSNSVRDLILWQADNGGLWTPSNVGRALIHGWEAGAWCGPIFDALHVGWTVTTINAVNKTDDPGVFGKTLPYRPALMQKIAVRFRRGDFESTLDLVALGRRFTDAANTASLPLVHTINVDFAYGWQLGPGTLDLLCAFRNVENVQYQLIDGYPLPGREVRVTLGYDMKLEPK